MLLNLKSSPATDVGHAFDAELKFSAPEGDFATFSGYGSMFGNIDNGRDMVMAGAFAETIKARGAGGIKMLWQHDPSKPIGVWTDIEEDRKGLKVSGKLLMTVQKAQEAYEFMKAGIVDGLSIGYRTIKDAYEVDKAGRSYRKLEKLDLLEVSLVTFPMNTRATVTAVKTMPTDRELEAMLRDEAGLSHRDAKAAVAVIKKTLRDGGETDEEPRDAAAEAISRELEDLLAVIRS